jgi:hypothetical protein
MARRGGSGFEKFMGKIVSKYADHRAHVRANKGVRLGVVDIPTALLAMIPFRGELLGGFDARKRAGVPETDGVVGMKSGGAASDMGCSVAPASSISTSEVGKSKAGGDDILPRCSW